MNDQVELHVGYIGKTREGKRVEIVRQVGDLCLGDDAKWYLKSGYAMPYEGTPSIIGPWTDQEAEYEVGKWYAHQGDMGCPIHIKTRVDYTYDTRGIGLNYHAASVNWSHPLLFRIVTPYVEPAPKLECWVNVYATSKSFHSTKERADSLSMKHRVRCVRMVEADEQ